jgi:hypothetical protein
MIKDLQKVATDDKDLQAFQDKMETFVVPFVTCAIIDGILHNDIQLQTGTVFTLEHRLGRALRGWIVVKKSAQADVWDSQATNQVKSTLLLNSSANVTVSVWVF